MTDTSPASSLPPRRRLAVWGAPIEHSQSPALHAAAYAVLGLDWEYGRARVESHEVVPTISGLDDSWLGLSLTMPLKAAVQPILDDIDLVARSTGAVNTVLFDRRNGDLVRRGFNTDVEGIVRALAAEGIGGARTIEVFGGGATAASAVAAAARMGAEEVLVTVRSVERAGGLADVASALGAAARIRSFHDRGADDAPGLVLSTLPGGASLDVDLPEALRATSVLFDVAYDPWPSALARLWTGAGGRVVSGHAMLVQQALIQIRIFATGDPTVALPDEERVLAAMLAVVAPVTVSES